MLHAAAVACCKLHAFCTVHVAQCMHGFTLHVAWSTLLHVLIFLCCCTPSHRSEHLLAHAVAGGRELEGRGERQAVDRRVQRAQLLAQQPRQHRDHLVCSAAQRTWRPRTVAFSSVCSAVADFPLSCCVCAAAAAALNLLDKVRRRRTRARVFVERRVERHKVRHVRDVHACDRRQSLGVCGRNDMER